MPKVSHVRVEVWDQATREFRFKSLPTVPDVELVALRDNVSLDPGGEAALGSLVVPPGSVLRVTLLRYLSSDDRGALFTVTQNGKAIDSLYLPSPGETLVTGDVEKPIYVLQGTVSLNLKAMFGSIYTGTVYGLTLHGYYSKQEELKYTT